MGLKTSIKKKFKQTLAMLFAVAMVVTSIPQTAYAHEANNVETTESVEAVETVETAESAETVETEEATESAETVETEQATESAETVETEEAIESEEAVETGPATVEMTEVEETTEVTETTESVVNVGNVVTLGEELTTYTVTTNVAEGATLTFDESTTPEEGKIAENTALKFTVVVADPEAKQIDTVTYSMGEAQNQSLTAEEDVYTTPAVTGDIVITVTLKEIVPVYTVTFGEATAATVSNVKVNDEAATVADDGTLANVEEGSTVTFKVDTEVTHAVVQVKAGENVIPPVDEVYSVTVTADTTISIETVAKNKVTFDGEGDFDSFVATIPHDGGTSGLVEGDYFYTTDESVSITIAAKAGYQIDKVEVNGVEQVEGEEGSETPKTSLTLEFTEDVKEYTVKVTTSVKKSTADAQLVFANASDNMSYTVTTNESVKKTAGKSNSYDVFAGADYVKFTVSASGKYEPVVTLNGNPIDGEKGATKDGKTAYAFTVLATVLAEGRNVVKISDTLANNTVTVTYDPSEAMLVTASIDGVKTNITEMSELDENGKVTVRYTVPYGSTITISAAALENCTLTKAVTKVGTGKAKNEKVSKNAVTFSVKATADANTEITSGKAYSVMVEKYEGDLMTPVKGVYNVEWVGSLNYTALVRVRYGNSYSDTMTITGAKFENEVKSTLEFSEDFEEGTVAKLTLDKADANKTLVATVTVDDGTEAGKKFTVKFKVAPLAAKVTVAGVKSGKLSQSADTVKEYALTYNPKGVSDIYDVSVFAVDSTEEDDIEAAREAVQAEIVNGKLRITTSQTVKAGAAKVSVYNTKTGEVLTGGTFTVNIVNPALVNTKPTVKLKSSDDVSLTLTLGSKVDEPVAGKVYYKVDVTSAATDEAVVNALAKKPFYFERTGNSQDARIFVNTSEFGSVKKSVKYNVKVTLVQTKDKEELTKENAEEKILFTAVKSAAGNNYATKAAYYETKLTLKKGQTTVYTGQSNVVVATAQYSKNTTFTTLKEGEQGVYLSSWDGDLEDSNKVTIVNDNNQIKVSVAHDTTPGKYTIRAVATAPDGMAPAEATITFTVAQGIEELDVYVPYDQVYKKNNTAASITAKASYNDDTDWFPKSKKVTWSVVDKYGNAFDKNDPLYGKISVKNGKVTIVKNYVVSDNEADNQFRIRATAADWKGNPVCDDSDVITIKTSTVSLGEVILVKEYVDEIDGSYYEVVARKGDSITTEEIASTKAVVLRKGAEEKDSYTYEELIADRVSNDDVNFSVSNKAVDMQSNGFIEGVTKAVSKVSITATAKDGSGKKAVLDKLTISWPKVNDLCLDFYMDDYTTDENDATKISYKADVNDTFGVKIVDRVSEEEDKYLQNPVNHTFKIKSGAKLIYSDTVEGYYEIAPTAEKTEIELTDKSKKGAVAKKTYTLTNTNWQTTAAPGVTTSDKLFANYYPKAQEVTFKVSDVEGYAGKTVRVSYDPVEYGKNGKYIDFIDETIKYDGERLLTVGEDGKFTLTWNCNEPGEVHTDLSTGSYKLYFTFGKMTPAVDENGETLGYSDFTAQTTTKAVTLKVVNPSVTKSTFKPTTSYKMYVKEGAQVELKGTGKGIDMSSLTFHGLQNVNVKGQSNNFTSFFELVNNDGKYFIRLKDGVNMDDIASTDLTAKVFYDVDGNDLLNYGCHGSAQIKITLEKAKTAQSYSSTGLTEVVYNDEWTVSGNKIMVGSVSGNSIVYAGRSSDNEITVTDAYSASAQFSVSVDDGELELENIAELNYASKKYTVESYVMTADNVYADKVADLKQAYEDADDGTAEETAAKTAYVNAIKAHGIKVKTTVNVKKPAAVKSVSITPATITLEKGECAQFDATVKRTDNTTEGRVKWSIEGATSENTIIDYGYLIIAPDEEAETIKVIAASKDNSSKKAIATVTVKEAVAVESITVTPETATVEKGKTVQFSATVNLASGEEDTRGVNWYIEEAVDYGIANGTEITENGLLTVAAEETATEIHVYAQSKKDATCSDMITVIIIDPITVASVTVTPSPAEVAKGRTLQFEAEVELSYGEDTDGVTWSISGAASGDTAISGEGLLTVAAEETATSITVTATSKKDDTKSGTATVNVVTVQSVAVIGLDKGGLEYQAGLGARQPLSWYMATVTLSDSTTSINGVTWSVEGATSQDTVIDGDYLLVGEDEKIGGTLILRATSVTDPSVSGTWNLTVVQGEGGGYA